MIVPQLIRIISFLTLHPERLYRENQNTIANYTGPRWAHNCEVKQATVDVLSQYHGASLRELVLGPYHIFGDTQSRTAMTNLETLSVSSLLSVHGTLGSPAPCYNYMVDNRFTLSTLDIGFEANLVRSYIAGAT